MPSRKILVLNGHPAPHSLSRLFAETYAKAAKAAGFDTQVAHLSDLAFDPDFGQGNYKSFKPLEPDLQSFMDQVAWADHFVLFTPMWWGGLPARLKGLFDRAFLPGNAFDPSVRKMGMPSPLLRGRTARIFVTSDTPFWALRLFYRRAILFSVEGQILKFVGFKTRKARWFSGASDASEKQVNAWVQDVQSLGKAGA